MTGKPRRRPPAPSDRPHAPPADAPPGGVLIDREGRYGPSSSALFKPLLRSIQRAVATGASVSLTGARLNVVILALQKAIWVEEEVLPRDLHAFSALNDRSLSVDQRLRTLAGRMLARPDRKRAGRAASYPTRRIVAEYRALTGQGQGDTTAYVSRQLSGLARQDEVFEPIRLPLSRRDAVQAIRTFHGFASRRAASAFIRAAIRALPASQRPRPPGAAG